MFRKLSFVKIGISSLVLSRFYKDKARQYLIQELAKIPGIPSKFGQMIYATHRDESPVMVHSPVLSIEEVKSLIFEGSSDLFRRIREISDQPQAASLGQVHWARLDNGMEVAIKIQYPGIEQAIQSDIQILVKALEKSPFQKKYSFDLQRYHDELIRFFSQEIDYSKEVNQQDQFFKQWSISNQIFIPKVFKQWSTKKILVQEYVESRGLLDLLKKSDQERSEIARSLFEFLLSSVFKFRLIHADLTPMNWGFSDSKNRLVVYDFGSVLEISERESAALRSLIDPEAPADRVVQAWIDLGFLESKVHLIQNRLLELHQGMAELFFGHGSSADRKMLSLGRLMESVLGEDRWWFRSAGPPWFLFLMRTVAAAWSSIGELDPSIDFSDLLKNYGFKSEVGPLGKKRETDQRADRADFLSAPKQETGWLKVLITENGEKRVELEMPGESVQNLEDLIPEEALEKIRLHGISLDQIKASVIQSGYQPQTLFDLSDGQRRYVVWLETQASM